MPRTQLSIRGSELQLSAWETAAEREERDLVDWARRVLDIAADSGLTIVQLRERLASPPPPPAGKRKA